MPADLEPATESAEDEDDPFGDDGVGGQSHRDHVLRRNAEFDQALRARPNDVTLWLEFASHSSTTHEAFQTRPHLSAEERTVIAEVKLARLERALTISGNEHNIDLHIAFLQCAADLWPASKLLERWRKVLESHPDDTTLWLEYVTVRSTSSADFSRQTIIGVYEDSIRVLRRLADEMDWEERGAIRACTLSDPCLTAVHAQDAMDSNRT